MSITAYTGLPGHGKSYGVIENVIAPACKAMRTVYTNIPCNTDVFLKRFGIAPVFFDVREIIENKNWFSEVFEPGSLFVVDECWRLWPAGLTANKIEEKHKEFFAEHRHLVGDSGHSTEIVLVTQDLAQIASFMRNLVETTFRVTKLSKVGGSKLYRVDVYSGPVTGPAPPIAKREREIPGKFKKEVYELYKSHTKSTVGAGDESRSDSRFNVLKGGAFKAIGLGILVLGFIVYQGASSLFSFGPVPDVEPQAVQQAEAFITESPAAQAPNLIDDFLRAADRVYISFNNGRFPAVDYVFRVVFGDGYAEMKAPDLLSLGYDVLPVSQCLVKITLQRRVYTAVCEPMASDRRDFISDLTETGTASGYTGKAEL